MARLEVRTNPLEVSDIEIDEFEFPSGGSPSTVLTDAEDIRRLQGSSGFRELLVDGAYDSGTTSTLQLIDGGNLIAQGEVLRFLTKGHRYDIFRQRFADATARLADSTTYVADDKYSMGLQEDDGSIWLLEDETIPTWTLFKAAAAATSDGLAYAIFKIDGGLVYDSSGHPQLKVTS